jgi:hypothetical protein
MSLKRGSVLAVLVLCLVLVGTVETQAQGLRQRVDELQAQLDQALATIAQLQTALTNEISARQAADTTLQNNIDAMGGGVTQAALDAAIAAEASLRSTADDALQEQIDNETAARVAADATFAPLSSVTPLASLVPLASYVTVATGDINDLAGPHVIFSGANVHVRSGHWSGESYAKNGKGNLIIGYNEPSGYVPAERGGSHNLVVGPNHRYNFPVGFITGHASRLGDMGASVSGGIANEASGMFSSVSGGSNNQATGQTSSVSGGDNNIAAGNTAAVSAGQFNNAAGDLSSVSGGSSNTAGASLSTVGGGSGHINGNPNTFVP